MLELGDKVKAWTEGVPFEPDAQTQIRAIASLSVVRPYVAVMPDVQYEGHGVTVGTVIPTLGAIIPAAVGVDIGCGVMGVQLSLAQEQLPTSLKEIYQALEAVIPVGRDSWAELPPRIEQTFAPLVKEYHSLVTKHPAIDGPALVNQMGTLGGGNHFVELSVDTNDFVWALLHTGSRGPGNRIGRYFIEKAQESLAEMGINPDEHLPHKDLAYLIEGDPLFKDYVAAVSWAQDYAASNRRAIMSAILGVLDRKLPPHTMVGHAINCHHNYVNKEHHFGHELWITRKGAIFAGKGIRGVIPGSMGTPSYIVEGLGNADSFCSSAHGAGRVMSRGEAKKNISLAQHARDTEDIECRQDNAVLDESPRAYKDIHAVMAAMGELVKPIEELHPILVLKG